jgi:hypothetical protein
VARLKLEILLVGLGLAGAACSRPPGYGQPPARPAPAVDNGGTPTVDTSHAPPKPRNVRVARIKLAQKFAPGSGHDALHYRRALPHRRTAAHSLPLLPAESHAKAGLVARLGSRNPPDPCATVVECSSRGRSSTTRALARPGGTSHGWDRGPHRQASAHRDSSPTH